MVGDLSATLIYGQRDAVLVDTFISVDQADVLVDWVKGSGNNLTTIYITHGHGDHFFALEPSKIVFPTRERLRRQGCLPGVRLVEAEFPCSSPSLSLRLT